MRYIFRGSLVFSLFAVAASAPGDDLTNTGGKKLTGTLVAVDKSGVTLKLGESRLRVAAKEIVLIDLGHRPLPIAKDVKITAIELTDGSRLRCSKFAIVKKAFAVNLLPGPQGVPAPTVSLPMSSVFYVLRRSEDEKFRGEWKKLLANRGKRDLYVIRQADGLTFVQGTVLEGTAGGTKVSFEKVDGTKDELLLSRATGGLVFNQVPAGQAPATICKVNDVFGNTLVAQSVEMVGPGMKVTTVSGMVVAYPSLSGVAKLDYAHGNVAYLSDLIPKVESPELPAEEAAKNLNVKAAYMADRAPANTPLRLDGVEYPKGLWIPADTVLTYSLNGEYREFRAIAGILDQVGDSATEVSIAIEADGRVLFSETIRRKDKPKGVTLDVKNVKSLRIQVESASPFFNGSQAILAEARVQK